MGQPLAPKKIEHIKALTAQGHRVKEIARHVGVSVSSVHKVRQGYYDDLLEGPPVSADEEDERRPVWCADCRCHVFLPCQMCRLRRYQRELARRPAVRSAVPLPATDDPRLLKRLHKSVAGIGLSLRTVNSLQQHDIFTVNDLLHCTRAELLRIPNFGENTLQHVYRCLKRLGFPRRRQSSQPDLRKAG